MHSIQPLSEGSTTQLATNYQQIRSAIARCAQDCQRDVNSITLLAVSKTREAPEVAALYQAGARHFGENYLQDALPKISALHTSCPAIVWHFIGAIQSNKTSTIATHFDWVHTVDRAKIATRLSAARPPALSPLNVCVQVNLHDEPQKAGVSLTELPELLATIGKLPRLALRGLMILPAKNVDPAAAFQRLAEVFKEHADIEAGLWDTLSMGMSNDYPAAIAQGSTMVRIGTALFGPRP